MSLSEGPRCALHFDVLSLATCTRCGRFCCQSCLVERDPPLCAACAPTVIDPYGLRAGDFDVLPAFRIAFKLVIGELPRLLAIVLLFSLPAAAVQVTLVGTGDDLETLAASIRVSSIYELLVGLIGAQSMLALLIARSEGRRLSLGAALNEGAQNWARAVGARFRSGLNILGFALLLILPGFWKATLLMFSGIAVLRSQERDALEASENLVRGRLGRCFGFALAAVFVCYGPMIVLGAGVGVACEALSFPRFPLELATDLVDRLGTDVAMTSVLYSGYVMLHRTARLELAPMRWRRRPELLSKR